MKVNMKFKMITRLDPTVFRFVDATTANKLDPKIERDLHTCSDSTPEPPKGGAVNTFTPPSSLT